MKEKDKFVQLAEERTMLAHERTILAYVRTAVSLLLFGIAFLGLRKQSSLFLYGGSVSIVFGMFFLTIAVFGYRRYRIRI